MSRNASTRRSVLTSSPRSRSPVNDGFCAASRWISRFCVRRADRPAGGPPRPSSLHALGPRSSLGQRPAASRTAGPRAGARSRSIGRVEQPERLGPDGHQRPAAGSGSGPRRRGRRRRARGCRDWRTRTSGTAASRATASRADRDDGRPPTGGSSRTAVGSLAGRRGRFGRRRLGRACPQRAMARILRGCACRRVQQVEQLLLDRPELGRRLERDVAARRRTARPPGAGCAPAAPTARRRCRPGTRPPTRRA